MLFSTYSTLPSPGANLTTATSEPFFLIPSDLDRLVVLLLPLLKRTLFPKD